jgi:hypothetical protein
LGPLKKVKKMQHFKKVLLTLGLTLSLFVGFSCSQILDNGLSTDIKAASRTILTGFAPAIFSEGQWYSEAPVGSGYAGTLTIYASLKNLSPEKGVQLVLTNNDWISHTAADFDYVPYYYYGWFDQPIASPNAHGIERWRISYKIPLGSDYSRVRFALKYDDGGLEHWDNNFTHNYSLVDLLD